MNNGYNIGFDSGRGYVEVYLEPKCKHESHRQKIGYIEDDNTFKCTNSNLMTLEVMEAIVNHWKVYRHDLEEVTL